jgi:hypothetical protein
VVDASRASRRAGRRTGGCHAGSLTLDLGLLDLDVGAARHGRRNLMGLVLRHRLALLLRDEVGVHRRRGLDRMLAVGRLRRDRVRRIARVHWLLVHWSLVMVVLRRLHRSRRSGRLVRVHGGIPPVHRRGRHSSRIDVVGGRVARRDVGSTEGGVRVVRHFGMGLSGRAGNCGHVRRLMGRRHAVAGDVRRSVRTGHRLLGSLGLVGRFLVVLNHSGSLLVLYVRRWKTLLRGMGVMQAVRHSSRLFLIPLGRAGSLFGRV